MIPLNYIRGVVFPYRVYDVIQRPYLTIIFLLVAVAVIFDRPFRKVVHLLSHLDWTKRSTLAQLKPVYLTVVYLVQT